MNHRCVCVLGYALNSQYVIISEVCLIMRKCGIYLLLLTYFVKVIQIFFQLFTHKACKEQIMQYEGRHCSMWYCSIPKLVGSWGHALVEIYNF